MKIVFTGGGTGGPFSPIIAVAERVNQIIDHEKILGGKLYYISDSPYDKEMLFENALTFEEIKTGKMRTHVTLKSFFLNFLDIFKIFLGTLNAIRIHRDRTVEGRQTPQPLDHPRLPRRIPIWQIPVV